MASHPQGGAGQAAYVNRLIDSSSPYLLQHAHNPVNWYPWGEEALELARAQNKPIFLSVGYSTCYWCHVMEREVFENPQIAALMNELFVNVKVDREQRPDLDEIYMTATQLMTRGGGWPNSLFLTPELKPFYAGTYFGATEQHGRPGFPTLIQSIAEAWRTRQPELLAMAERVTLAVRDSVSGDAGMLVGTALTAAVPDLAVAQIAQRYDAQWGGFGGAPKFPQDFYFEFLLDVQQRTRAQPTLDMAVHSLQMMAAGGIHDHVGGGFHRYSTDAQWLVPHFEKMLYNQAQLARAYVRAYEATGDQTLASTARDTLAYVSELMTGPDGQFYSALDAETDAVEGAYYAWSRAEVETILSREQLPLFDQIFDLGAIPIFPGHKHPSGEVLFMRRPLAELAVALHQPLADLQSKVREILSVLKSHRDGRALPRLDDKVIASWSGMMIGAYARAGAALADNAYLAAAQRGADFVLTRMRDDRGHLWRIWRGGVAEQPAFLEDYAFVIQGLLALHEATNDARWLTSAVELTVVCDTLLWDSSSGGYFFARASPDLIARIKSISDGAIPSGNSVMLHNLLALWQRTGDSNWKQRLESMLQVFGGALAAAPTAQVHMVHALEKWLRTKDAAIAASAAVAGAAARSGAAAAGSASPERVIASVLALPASVRRGEEFVVHVDLAIAPTWHINANPASDAQLIPTVVDLRCVTAPAAATDAKPAAPLMTVASIAYPSGHDFKASEAAAAIKVLSGNARISIIARLSGEAAVGSSLPLRVYLQYQPCDDNRCLAPVERILELSLEIVE